MQRVTDRSVVLKFGGSEIGLLLKNILENARLGQTQRESLLRELMTNLGTESSPWMADRLADTLDPDYTLRNELLLRSGIPTRQSSAAQFFQTNPVKPERIIPLLSSCLASTNQNLVEQCAKALGAYGNAATNVPPDLKALQHHANP